MQDITDCCYLEKVFILFTTEVGERSTCIVEEPARYLLGQRPLSGMPVPDTLDSGNEPALTYFRVL